MRIAVFVAAVLLVSAAVAGGWWLVRQSSPAAEEEHLVAEDNLWIGRSAPLLLPFSTQAPVQGVEYAIYALQGDLYAGIWLATSPSDPFPGSFDPWAPHLIADGSDAVGLATLHPDTYTLAVHCAEEQCEIAFSLRLRHHDKPAPQPPLDVTECTGRSATPVEWWPDVPALPTTGSFAAFEEEGDDPWATGLLTSSNSRLWLRAPRGEARLAWRLREDVDAHGYLQLANCPRLVTGSFAGTANDANLAVPALGFIRTGSGCGGAITFTIDDVAYDAYGDLDRITVRFTQDCYSVTRHGMIHWAAHERTPPCPALRVPEGETPPSAASSDQSSLRVVARNLETGQDKTYWFPGTTVMLSEPMHGAPTLRAQAEGGEWDLSFALPDTCRKIQPGLYLDVDSANPGNPATGWAEYEGREDCNLEGATFVVDEVSYAGPSVERLVVRFSLVCNRMYDARDGAPPELTGQIVYRR